MISKHFQHFLIINHKSLIHEYSIIEFKHYTIFGTERHPGAWGKLRVSARHLDEEKSTEYQPVHTHDRTEKLKPGEIVPVDIEIWPISRIWHKGQKLRVQVAGRYIRDEWFEPLVWFPDNKGVRIPKFPLNRAFSALLKKKQLQADPRVEIT